MFLRKIFISSFLFLASYVFADDQRITDIYCTTSGGGLGQEELTIICKPLFGDSPEDTDYVLTKDACLDLKMSISSAISEANDYIGAAVVHWTRMSGDLDNFDVMYDNLKEFFQQAIYGPPNPAYLIVNDPIATNYIFGSFKILDDLKSSARTQFSELRASLDQAQLGLGEAQQKVDAAQCSNQSCTSSGGGLVDCPCQDEFKDILSIMNSNIKTWEHYWQDVTKIKSEVIIMNSTVSNVYDQLESLVKRVEAPDDRMWGEIRDIYHNIASNATELSQMSLNLEQIFYNIRKMILDAQSDDDKLKLSTEGVVALNTLAFDIANFAMSQNMLWEFKNTSRYFMDNYSNVVHVLFDEYLNVGRYSAINLPSELRYRGEKGIYSVFTNSSYWEKQTYPARRRFLALMNDSHVTNWFQRMELYQQAQLGWFDDHGLTAQEQEQDKLTESQIDYDLYTSTNGFGLVVSSFNSVTNNVGTLFFPVSDGLSGVIINSYLPSQIRFLPEVELGDFGTFGPIDFDTSGISEYCNIVRLVTSLIWRLIIWALYIGLAVVAVRVLVIGVMYVIHILQRL